MTDRRGTHDKHVTVPDAVNFGVSSDIATITVTGSCCTGGNRSKFILTEDKRSFVKLRLILRKQKAFCEVFYVQISNHEFFKQKKDQCQICDSYKMLLYQKNVKETEIQSHHKKIISARKKMKTTNKQYTTCITWILLISKQHYQMLQQTFHTAVITANSFLTIVLSVTVRRNTG
jgi:hypothetical protein